MTVRMQITTPVTHLCPFVEEKDVGELVATWEGDEVELHDLSRLLLSFYDTRVSHEDFTETITKAIERKGGIGVQVTTYWETANLEVVVQSGRSRGFDLSHRV